MEINNKQHQYINIPFAIRFFIYSCDEKFLINFHLPFNMCFALCFTEYIYMHISILVFSLLLDKIQDMLFTLNTVKSL